MPTAKTVITAANTASPSSSNHPIDCVFSVADSVVVEVAAVVVVVVVVLVEVVVVVVVVEVVVVVVVVVRMYAGAVVGISAKHP